MTCLTTGQIDPQAAIMGENSAIFDKFKQHLIDPPPLQVLNQFSWELDQNAKLYQYWIFFLFFYMLEKQLIDKKEILCFDEKKRFLNLLHQFPMLVYTSITWREIANNSNFIINVLRKFKWVKTFSKTHKYITPFKLSMYKNYTIPTFTTAKIVNQIAKLNQ